MDWHEILLRLTTFNENVQTGGSRYFCGKLEEILPMLTDEIDESDLSLRYVKTLVLALEKLNEANQDQGSISVDEFRTVRRSVDLIFLLGIVPNLLPGVGVEASKIFPKLPTFRLTEDETRSDYQKHDVLRFSLVALLKLFNAFLFRPSIVHRLNLLLPSLLQLSFAPLNKHSLTYGSLAEDQNEFKESLTKLIEDCPKFMTMKELMVILGVKGSPKWLQVEVRRLLVRLLTEPGGVSNLFAAVCEDSTNDSKDWLKFEVISRLVAANHVADEEKYYCSVCKQLLDLLNSTKNPSHFSTIAAVCISTLYKTNPRICREKIVEILLEPLSRPGSRISGSVESLCSIFLPSNHSLPCEELSSVALQLFSMFEKLNRSPFALKTKVRQLLLGVLSSQSLFGVFLGCESTDRFGRRLETTFASDGDLEIVSVLEDDDCSIESRMDALHDLLIDHETTLNRFFCYLLRLLTDETHEDEESSLRAKIAAVQMLSRLSNVPSVVKFQVVNPRHVIELIKSLVNQPDKEEILYVGLMIAGEILSKSTGEIEPFRELVACLKENEEKLRSTRLKSVAKELINSVENFNERGNESRKYFEDLSINENGDEFEEALRDLRDPLLPIRAHGIVKLTKLVEKRDFNAVDQKELILQIFKENLKDDDSFVYLAAINGLCALATSFPASVIECLMLEYVRMPEKFRPGEISVENRCKLGEILVKTTRALGETASAHKNLLLNGFLHATRDSDATMRASSLSCLGELCKVLGFRLGGAINEVLYCVSMIVESDESADCRRAAVMVATLLLRGLGNLNEALDCLGENVGRLYRSLKRLRDRDEDPVLRLHAQLALEEFDRVARDFLFAPAKLEKKILLLH